MIPEQYSWLKKEPAPKILIEALKEYGTVEVKGTASNPKILKWSHEVGSDLGIEYSDDSVPWCGLFVAACAKRAGYSPPLVSIRASSWDSWGDPVKDVYLGDILRFQREGGGHVGIYVGEDDVAYHVLGGNQSDSVNITRIFKDRLVTIRRSPFKLGPPKNLRRIYLSPKGTISRNEK